MDRQSRGRGENKASGRLLRISFARTRLAAQPRNELPQRLAAVAQTVLELGRQLGGRAIAAGYVKYGVVTEAVAAAWRKQDAAFPVRVTDERRGVGGVAQIHHHALKARAALRIGHVGETRQQFLHVVTIGGGGARITRGINTGRAVERIDFQTRIVGNRGCTCMPVAASSSLISRTLPRLPVASTISFMPNAFNAI